MKAKELMTKDVVCVPRDYPISRAFALMAQLKVRHLPVVEGQKLFGIISDRDILPFTNNGVVASDLCVHAIMTTDLITRETRTSAGNMAELMISKKIDSVPIVEGGRFVGLVTSSDLLALLLPPYQLVEEPPPFRFNLLRSDVLLSA